MMGLGSPLALAFIIIPPLSPTTVKRTLMIVERSAVKDLNLYPQLSQFMIRPTQPEHAPNRSPLFLDADINDEFAEFIV
jgi:hypothetical protein